ncbi:MAG: hypothetical protein ACRD0J_00765, partial [Acidimicrobiales bacterium]
MQTTRRLTALTWASLTAGAALVVPLAVAGPASAQVVNANSIVDSAGNAIADGHFSTPVPGT